MFIVPINSSIDLSKFNAFKVNFENAKITKEEPAPPETSGFKEIFQGLINDVEKSEAVAAEDSYKLSIGAMDDPHTAVINSAKAELTLSMMMQIRNKLLEAYQEIMRINI
jgi:flagellar hook-basal body complex protein FliE